MDELAALFPPKKARKVQASSLGSVYDLLRKGPLPKAKAPRCVCDVACGITHMHALGYAHRDIKAESFLGRYKVADFGLSVYTKDEQQHGSAGTVDYTSPKVAAGQPHDATTDLWSLGVLAYGLLVGHPPFSNVDNDTPDEIKKQVRVGHVWRPPRIADSAWEMRGSRETVQYTTMALAAASAAYPTQIVITTQIAMYRFMYCLGSRRMQ
ncbi:hypothetical protein SDRG_02332 [Saprolegnia diclina VS20]|uniref:Protein kinase domain-containing protein n=1 Tax=Saprolegnia diclina (strain VS20) TaxID=1156394 RepID=T0R0G3_SAPDV|nr:hypothetical protein SDRG_02332 [Saprolegnia diclina VS20]EQC40436.1 hypothetical protein SDRG_02332 [Saprolegnia diclina VS20]|eukprot:XP_008606135.1 hypothetical protein SDRG_02332 [Saprolegnia diclina VS20]